MCVCFCGGYVCGVALTMFFCLFPQSGSNTFRVRQYACPPLCVVIVFIFTGGVGCLPFFCCGFFYCVSRLLSIPGGLSECRFHGLGSEFGPFVVSCGPGALFGCVYGGGSLGIGRDLCVVSSAFQHGRTRL